MPLAVQSTGRKGMPMTAAANPDLVAILAALSAADYSFIAVTPATHGRMLGRRRGAQARTLRDAFGWNLPFSAELLPEPLLRALERAGALEPADRGLLRSGLRVASLDGRLFLHSAYPTEHEDAVFFGPDTYRFARFIASALPGSSPVARLVDIGSGSGAGALVAGRLLPGAGVVMTDINPAALRLAAANAAHAGVTVEQIQGSDLAGVEGDLDLILANPPFVMDEKARTYRHGGDMLGARLSLDWALAGAERLARGGRMLLYTGVAIVDGRDGLREALVETLPARGCRLAYSEIDPDIFGEELDTPAYSAVERIAAVGAVITRR
jgi:methylase of polypeptide subunit release factors